MEELIVEWRISKRLIALNEMILRYKISWFMDIL
jgi:hypothetical protein